VSHEGMAEIMEPTVGPFDLPASREASEGSAILLLCASSILSVRTDQFDPALPQSLAMNIAVQRAVVDQSRGFPGRQALIEQRFEKTGLAQRRAGHQHRQWRAVAVDQQHDLRTLAPFGQADRFTPLSAPANAPSANVSSSFSRPRSSSRSKCRRHACSSKPSSVHSKCRRGSTPGRPPVGAEIGALGQVGDQKSLPVCEFRLRFRPGPRVVAAAPRSIPKRATTSGAIS
jgi:hypothetical protein